MFSSPEEALALTDRATAAARTDAQRAEALWLRAEALTRTGDMDGALTTIASAEALLPGTPTALHGHLALARARVHLQRADHVAALGAFHVAHENALAVGDERGQAVALMGIAKLYRHARRWDRALDYFARAEAVQAGDPDLSVALDNNRGAVLREAGRLEEAAAAFERNLERGKMLGKQHLVAASHLQLADLAVSAKDLGAARMYLTEANLLREVNEGDPAFAPFGNYARLIEARLATAEGDDAAAASAYLALFSDYDWTAPDDDARRAHEAAADLFARTGRPALAYRHMKAFSEIESRVNGAAAANSFNLLSAEFEAAARELEIARLDAARLEAEVAAAAQRDRTRTLITAIMGLASAGVLLTVLWHLRSAWNASRVLEEKNHELTEANAAKTRFLANTSHEIRTPLNAILGMTEALLTAEEADALPRRARTRLRTIERSGTQLLDVITDILDVSAMEGGKVAPNLTATDVGQVVRDACEANRPAAAAKGLALEVSAPDDLPLYETDVRMIAQAVGHLVANAVKFTDEGRIEVALSTDEDGFAVEVTDTGPGIAPTDHRRVFDAFAQVEADADRRHGGTGLGLAVVRHVAAALGGAATVRSALGEGAAFTLRVPAEAVPRATAEAVRDDLADLAALRVLLAEDNPVNVAVVRALIGSLVASLDVAEDGAAALDRVRMQPYDLVLMDNQMPRMSGEDATRAIRALPDRAGLPIVGVTGDVAPTMRRTLGAAGMDMVLTKPVSRDALIEALRLAAARAGADGSPAARTA